MVMQSIDLSDRLSLNTADAQLSLSCDDPSLGGDDNLIPRAHLLRDRSVPVNWGRRFIWRSLSPSVLAWLVAPATARGTGGSECLWGLGHSPAELECMAAELGSDMPFCVAGGCQLCFGRGEQLEAVPATPRSLAVLWSKTPGESQRPGPTRCRSSINPTTSLMRRLLNNAGKPCAALVGSAPCVVICHLLRNDLQEVVAPQTAAVRSALDLLKSIPHSLAVAMSGSGPSCLRCSPIWRHAARRRISSPPS